MHGFAAISNRLFQNGGHSELSVQLIVFYRFRTVCSNTLESCETIDNLGFIITRLVEVNFVKIAHALVYSRNESGSVRSGRDFSQEVFYLTLRNWGLLVP